MAVHGLSWTGDCSKAPRFGLPDGTERLEGLRWRRRRRREGVSLCLISQLSLCFFSSFFVGDPTDFKIVLLLEGLNEEPSKLPGLPHLVDTDCPVCTLICSWYDLEKLQAKSHTEEEMRKKVFSPP